MAIAPLQLPSYAAPQSLDFTPLAKLGDVYRQAQQRNAREQALSKLGQGGALDYNAAARALLAAGDTEGGLSLARLAESSSRDTRDFQFRQDEARRAQGNTDRSFGLQEKQATEKPTYQVIEDQTGNKRIFKMAPLGGGITDVTPSSLAQEGGNPFSPGGKMNEAQSKDALYANRMLNAERIFRDPAVVAAGQSAVEVGKTKLPGAGTFYNPNSVEYQKFDQAKRDFINAVLRRESGAVIADTEFANAERQYFPRPGDSKEVLDQKQANRIEAIKGIGAGAGQSYRPAYTFDDKGGIVEPKRAAPKAGGITKEQYDALPSGATYTAPDGSQRVKR